MSEEKLRVSTGYRPRVLQAELHRNAKRFNIFIAHRRFGKTVWAVNHSIHQGFKPLYKRDQITKEILLHPETKKPLQWENPQYAYVGPFINQAKKVAWDYYKNALRDIPLAKPNETELRIDIMRPETRDRIRHMLIGADNIDAIRGIYLDGVVIDEYAEMNPRVWEEVIRPTLSDRKGWAVFIGTFKGANHYYKMYEKMKYDSNWHCVKLKASETKIIDPDELEMAKQTMSKESFDQEYECSVESFMEAYYYATYMSDLESAGRIRDVPYDPCLPVQTFWDLGIGDTTAIWFIQAMNDEFRAIDYLEMSGKGLDYYVREIKNRPYTYADYHTLPHDVEARSIDTGRTRKHTLEKLGLRVRVLPKLRIEEGINAARMLLPKFYFDRDKCKRGIQALKEYRRKFNKTNQIYEDTPVHDVWSNGADSFRYACLGLKAQSNPDRELQKFAINDYDIFKPTGSYGRW